MRGLVKYYQKKVKVIEELCLLIQSSILRSKKRRSVSDLMRRLVMLDASGPVKVGFLKPDSVNISMISFLRPWLLLGSE